jgi:ABC-2 type transport system ATP-binding protein
MGKTILISSHILADLADVCTKIALIEKGRLLFSGPVHAAIDLVSRDDIWLVEVLEDRSAALAALNAQPFVAEAVEENGQIVVRLAEGSSEAHQIPRILMERGLRLRSFRRREVTLEEAFLRLTKGEVS